jgi:aryl-alcohol dehydrogenase-like predicted oxidoreductase
MGMSFGYGPPKDKQEMIALIRAAVERGITFFDTADNYGNSEERIGKAISGRSERPVIATKYSLRTREDVESHLQLSLKRLGVTSIDLYQFHGVSGLGHALDFHATAPRTLTFTSWRLEPMPVRTRPVFRATRPHSRSGCFSLVSEETGALDRLFELGHLLTTHLDEIIPR